MILRTIVLGADEDLSQRLEMVFLETGRFGLVRSFDSYLDDYSVERLIRVHGPQVIFLCADDIAEAGRVKQRIDQTLPGLPVVAFGRDACPEVLIELMKLGVREFLRTPFDPAEIIGIADRIERHLAENPLDAGATDRVFSFLPAKPGVGTSTLAVNLAVAMAAIDDTKVLLTDFDFNSGLVAFMLKLNPPYTIVDAVLRSEDLDENLWPQLVTKAEKLDILPCGRPEPGVRVEPIQIHRMISFARRQYDVICVDLSGNMEKYAVELMMESKHIFLVTTPEIPPLHLARERLQFLRSIELADRVKVLVNRWGKRTPVTIRQIQELLEAPVFECFPNNYAGVHAALMEGRPIDSRSDLGRQIRRAALRILNPELNPETEKDIAKKKRFLESFSILSSKYSLTSR